LVHPIRRPDSDRLDFTLAAEQPRAIRVGTLSLGEAGGDRDEKREEQGKRKPAQTEGRVIHEASVLQ
jgi:hypothetical protein